MKATTALRCSVALSACFLAYALPGHLTWGILAALGAIYAGLASYNGILQMRLLHMATTSLMVAGLAAVGTLVGGDAWVAITTVAVVGFVFSLYAALHPEAIQVATMGTACLIVFSKVLPGANDIARAAAGNGLIVLSGGLAQIVALVLVWRLRRFRPERQVVAVVYDDLQSYVIALSEPQAPQMLSGQSILDAHSTIDPLTRFRRQPEQIALRRALTSAEGIRACLVALGPSPFDVRAKLGTEFAWLRLQLKVVADRVRHSDVLNVTIDPRPDRPDGIDSETTAILDVMGGLLTQLTIKITDAVGPRAKSEWQRHLSLRRIALEASSSLRLMALRHAARLALALLAAGCLARFSGLHNGYWVTLTTCLILRTDYATTFERGFARSAGTMAGVILALAFDAAFHPTIGVQLAIIVATGYGIFAYFRANYALYSVLITLWVLSSLAAAGVPEQLTAGYRLENTVIGTVLAFAAYFLLPTWQSGRVREVLSDAARSQAQFCERVLLMPALPSRRVWEPELERTRALRYEAESVVGSASKEPVWKDHHTTHPASEILYRLERNAAKLLVGLAQRLSGSELSHSAEEVAEAARSEANQMVADMA